MAVPELKHVIQSLCLEVPRDDFDAFFARMDEDYFSTFPPDDIATHIRMATALSEERPVQVRITPTGKAEYEVVIVGFDRLGQFSIFCGLLAAFAFDIRRGDIYSFTKGPQAAKVVDVFRVEHISEDSFGESRQREFEQELKTFAHLLADSSIQEARMRLYAFLTERIETMDEPLLGLSSPLSLTFDNEISADWTVMEVQSEDTFAFLYAVSNALSLRGINIAKVKIRSAAKRTNDQFFIADILGRKIKAGVEQDRLSLAVGMIKQFTRFITEAPDPAKAMHHFDQFLDRLVAVGENKSSDRTLSILAHSDGMSRLAQLLGSSDYLWADFLQIHFTELLPMIEDDVKIPGKAALQRQLRAALNRAPSDEQRTVLNAFKDRQVFLIDIQHLLQPNATLLDFSRALTDLAEVVIAEATRLSIERISGRSGGTKRHTLPGRFAIFGLGKFGGREMGYASDLELLFVHDGDSEVFESLAKQIVGFIETREKGIFQIDMRLRPHGEAGPWSTSVEQFRKYYSHEGDAAPFERQALIKLRWCAGDAALGRRVEKYRDSFTYSGERWDWEDALHLRKRQMKELVKPGKTNVKFSAGGIIDIEYAVQYLQILNGGEYPQVRLSTTLEALDQLRRMQIVREADYRLLHSSYLFLRKVIDALRIVRGNASDLVLPGETTDEFKSLARRLGYAERDRAKSAARLAADIREAMAEAHKYFVARFDRSQDLK